jgi:high-affinity nickel-transport protein
VPAITRAGGRQACCEQFAVVSATVSSATIAEEPAATAPPTGRLSTRERRSIGGMSAFVLLLHVVGWGVLVFAVAPHDYRLGSTGVLGVGVGL